MVKSYFKLMFLQVPYILFCFLKLYSNMDLSSCLELRSSRCVASSASMSNGFTSWENNGRKEGIEKKSKSEENINNGDSVESMSQRSGFNLVGISAGSLSA